MLITTGVKLKLLQDIDQLLFFEKGIRGRINGLGALRHFEANKNHLENFNSEEESTVGAFFDVNVTLCWYYEKTNASRGI